MESSQSHKKFLQSKVMKAKQVSCIEEGNLLELNNASSQLNEATKRRVAGKEGRQPNGKKQTQLKTHPVEVSRKVEC